MPLRTIRPLAHAATIAAIAAGSIELAGQGRGGGAGGGPQAAQPVGAPLVRT
jgi:hypothetical protein